MIETLVLPGVLNIMRRIRLFGLVVYTLVSACVTSDRPRLEAIQQLVDLPRFMGEWYVIGSIPIDMWFASEAGAHNSVERYVLRDDGKIITNYTFRKDSFDGEKVEFNPVGWVHNVDNNAEWRMQFFWPFRSVYLIAYLDESYQYTVIGVPNRRHVWNMSRQYDLSEEKYSHLLNVVTELGYDASLVQRIPQQWPDLY